MLTAKLRLNLQNQVNRIITIIVVGVVGATVSARAAESAAGVEFFEKRIRPVLADHCYKCHAASSDKLKGGLFLDLHQEAWWRAGVPRTRLSVC